MIKKREIYLVKAMYGECDDVRPCVVVELLQNGLVKVALISSALDLYRPQFDLLLDSKHHDFKYTGLKRTSYISGWSFLNVLPNELTRKPIGVITGDLASDFDNWFGS
jgi:hypothetical protein